MLPLSTTMIKTAGIHHVHLHVADLERSKQFYATVFGMVERFRVGSTMIFLATQGSRDLLTLNQVAAGTPTGDNGGIDHFGFATDDTVDIDQAVAEIVAAGGSLVRRGEHSPGHHFAYCRDPDGYSFEI
jgi:catechol 2,3-dioxygenase-like lactoylglutathione lyase family enzyme